MRQAGIRFTILVAISTFHALFVPRLAADCVPSPAGLVGWWRMEGTGLDAVSGNSREIQGDVLFMPGKIGKAAVFGSAGFGGRIDMDPRAELKATNFTVQAWVRRADTNVVTPGGVNASIYTGDNGPFTFGLMNDGTLFYYQPNAPFVQSTNAIKDLEWHHVTVRREASNLRFYIDGVIAGSSAYSVTASYQYVGRYYIGVNLLGSIDEVTVFSRALSESEIQAIATAQEGFCITDVALQANPLSYRVTLGDSVVYTTTLINLGSAPVSDIVIDATFGSAFANASLETTKGAAESSTRITVPSLAPGERATLTIRGQPSAIGPSTNELRIVSPSDFSIGNNAVQVAFMIVRPYARTPAGLVAWWPGSNTENGGEVFGRYTSGFPGFVAGKVGEAFRFSGDGNSLTVGGGSDFNLVNFSVEAWIRRGSTTEATKKPSLNSTGRICGMMDGWNFALAPDGALWLMNGYTALDESTNEITDLEWHHVAVTKDGATVRFYIDGGIAGEAIDDRSFTNDTRFRISGLPADYGGYNGFLGDIDELSFYDRAITGEEISRIIAAAPAPKTSTDLGLSTTTPLARPASGEAASFSVFLRNSGEPWATNSVVSIDIPAGATITEMNTATGQVQQDGSKLVWNAGALPLERTPRSLNFKATLNTPGSYFFNATATTSSQDIRPINNTTQMRADRFTTSCTVAPPGLVAFYDANEGFEDRVLFGTLINPSGVQRVPGLKGQAFRFTGFQHGLRFPAPELPSFSNFSIELWIQREGAAGLFFNSNEGMLRAGIAESGQIYFTPHPGTTFLSTDDVNDPFWHHIVITKDGASVAFFLDGQAAGTFTVDSSVMLKPPYAIGSAHILSGPFYDPMIGLLDEFSLYSAPITETEARRLFLAGANGKCTDDISVSSAKAMAILPVGETNIVSFVITNRGATDALGVTFTNVFPATLKIAAMDSAFLVNSNDTTYYFNFGTVEAGGSREIRYHVYSTAAGDHVINGGAGRTNDDLTTLNNSASANFTTPTLTVFMGSDVSVYEPDSEPTGIAVSLFLNLPSAIDRTAFVRLNNGTARAGVDYAMVTNKVVFRAGSTNASIPVTVLGDFLYEGAETFQAELDLTNQLAVGGSAATITITDNDAAPHLELAGAMISEGNAGATNARFRVRLLGVFEHAIGLSYSTTNSTATAGADYEGRTGVVTFQPTEHEKFIEIPVLGDTVMERNESFLLTVKGIGTQTLRAAGTIVNDDGIDANQPFRFVWDPPAHGVSVDSPIAVHLRAVNEEGWTVETFNGNVSIAATRGKRQSPLLITEIDMGSRDAVEIQNVSASTVNIGGWRLYVYDAVNWPAPAAVVEFPGGTTLASGAITVVGEGNVAPPGGYLFEAPVSWLDAFGLTTYSPTAALLEDAVGNVRDLVVANGANPTEIRDPHRIVTGEWEGKALTLEGFRTVLQRFGNENQRSATGWTNVSAGSIGATNRNLSVPFVDSALISVIPDATGLFERGEWSGEAKLQTPAAPVSFVAIDTAGRLFFSPRFSPAVPIDLEARVTVDPPLWTYGAIGTRLLLTVINNGQTTASNVIGELAFPLTLGTYGATVSQGTTDTIASATEVRRRARFGNIPTNGLASLTIDVAKLPGASSGSSITFVPIRGSVSNLPGEINLANNSNSIVAEISRTFATRPTGLAAWWPGEWNTLDALGTNTLTASAGVTYEPGRIGYAFRLHGEESPLTAPPDGIFNIPAGENFGMEFWLKVLEQPNDGIIDLVQKMNPDATESTVGWRVRLDRGDLKLYYCDALSASSFTYSAEGERILDGQWHHLSFQIKRAGSFHTGNLTIDGVALGQGWGRSIEGGAISNSAPLVIGSGLIGLIDEIGFYRSTNDLSPSFAYTYGGIGKLPGGIDSDHDGIPDAWQFAVEQELLPLWLDADQDGSPTWQEIVMGTMPSDPESVFALTGTMLTNGQIEFRFPAFPNRNYVIERSPTADGSAGWTKVATPLPPPSPTDFVLRVPAIEGFYRVTAR